MQIFNFYLSVNLGFLFVDVMLVFIPGLWIAARRSVVIAIK